MASDVGVLVRDLYRAVDAGQSRVTADDVVAGRVPATKPVRGLSTGQRFAGWAVGAVAAGVVLLVGALTLFMVSGDRYGDAGDPSPSDTTPTTAIESPTTTPSVTTTIATESSNRGEVVGSRYVGLESSLGTLAWTRVQGGANSCPPVVVVDEERGGYLSLWCKGGAMHSDDGLEWSVVDDYPDHTIGVPPWPSVLDSEPPTFPVDFVRAASGVTQTLFFSRTEFGWVATQPFQYSQEPRSPRMWISTSGFDWEQVEPPPNPEADGHNVWSGQGGGAGDLLYFGYVTTDYDTGNYLWVGHFSHP